MRKNANHSRPSWPGPAPRFLMDDSGVSGTRRLVVVDADMGCDDAIALLILLRAKSAVEVLAVTTVAGNVGVKQGIRNAAAVLKAIGRTDVPVYEGSAGPILRNSDLVLWDGHGKDGLGDSGLGSDPDLPPPQPTHAVSAIVELFKSRPGEIELLALGPLTNIALAVRIDPAFPTWVKHLTIMGGCESARGNSSMAAEFNFFADPEAAHIVLDAFAPEQLLPVRPAPFVCSALLASANALKRRRVGRRPRRPPVSAADTAH